MDIAALAATQVLLRICLIICNTMSTVANTFGLWQQYLYRPLYNPDDAVDSTDLHSDTLLLLLLPPTESIAVYMPDT